MALSHNHFDSVKMWTLEHLYDIFIWHKKKFHKFVFHFRSANLIAKRDDAQVWI